MIRLKVCPRPLHRILGQADVCCFAIHRSSYNTWRSRRDRRDHKALSDALLGVRITEVFRQENGCYGAKRITAELNDDPGSTPLNHKRVARIMKNVGLLRVYEATKSKNYRAG